MKSLLCFSSQTESREHIVAFNMLNYRSCKNLWKSCVEHHTFFQAKKLLPQEKNVVSQYWTMGSRNPKKWVCFRASVHTTLDGGENMSWWRLGSWPPPSGEGIPSHRGPGTGPQNHGRRSLSEHSQVLLIAVVPFCLLNSAVLVAPRQPELQLLPHHVTVREAVSVRGSDSEGHVAPGIWAFLACTHLDSISHRIFCKMFSNNGWMIRRKDFPSQVTLGYIT